MADSAFVISLDFELFWGVRDHVRLADYRDQLLGARAAIPRILELFASRGVRATWATVGFLFCRTKTELLATLPARRPRYRDPALSPYDLTDVGEDERTDPFHYAPSLVEAIARAPGQEVGTHTFSHFYCLEDGQTADDFSADLDSALVAAGRLGIEPRSLVLPRNQDNRAYHPVIAGKGIQAFRSVGSGWPYSASPSGEPTIKRALRLADAYLPLTGSRAFPPPRPDAHGLVDVPASSFLRPFSRRSQHLDRLLLHRTMTAMSTAAERGELFHLWWHPHNFGRNLGENLARLTLLLDHFASLSSRLGMRSMTMSEVAARSLAIEKTAAPVARRDDGDGGARLPP